MTFLFGFFPSHILFKVHPCGSMSQYFFPFFFFLWWIIFHCMYVCMYVWNLFIHFSVDRHLVSFHFWAITNNVSVNICVQISGWAHVFFFSFFNVYLWATVRGGAHTQVRKQGRGRERGGQRILSGLCAESRGQCRARTHGPWDHDLSPSWMLNGLSHPGALSICFLFSSVYIPGVGLPGHKAALCFTW